MSFSIGRLVISPQRGDICINYEKQLAFLASSRVGVFLVMFGDGVGEDIADVEDE